MMRDKSSNEFDRYEMAQIAGKFNYCEPYVPMGEDGHLVVNARVGSLQELIRIGVKSIYPN